jgi:uncharacterized protein (DUF58 family)
MTDTLEQRAEHWLQFLSLRIALPVLAAVVFLIAWNRGVALLYGLVALLVGALVVARIAPHFNLRGVTARRDNPAAAHEGDVVAVELEVRASGWRARYMLEVGDSLPFADAEQQTPMVFVDRLKGAVTLRHEVRCDLRGEHELGPLQVATSYPLGIHRVQRTIPDSAGRILVYPQPFPIHALPLIGASQSPIMGMQAASVSGGNDRFFGVREYRHGDNPRHIHWAATARRGELIVKEYEFVQNTQVVIVLDLRRDAQYGEGKHSTLEYAVKIAASVARFALAGNHGVGLLGFGAHPVEVPLGRGSGHYQTILETLARVRADGNTPYLTALHEAAGRLPGGGILFLFEHDPWQRTAERQQMFSHHIRPLRVRFDGASFEREPGKQSKRPAGQAGGTTYFVRNGDDLARVFAA